MREWARRIFDREPKTSDAPRQFTFEEMSDLFSQIEKHFMGKPLVVGVGIGAEEKPDGSMQPIVNVFLEKAPTLGQKKSYGKVYKGARIRYEITGSIDAV